MAQSNDSGMERTDEPWKYPYIAAVLDFGSNFTIRISTESGARVGHVISPQIFINNTDPAVLGFIDEFSMNHGLNPRFREREHTYELGISKRDDVRDLLQLVRPYIIARNETVTIILEDLIPGLEAGKQGSEEGWLELMGYVDKIREHTVIRKEPKYTQEYFQKLFND